ncbi:(2Fe-2S)-binding protein [Veillonella montpellierensis]|uniref:(2Fe-2S)-binding protein n=1 Tax=Veillonella montpellierensis TaxID=187328 RepID=UPI0023F703F3|nr:(2Fe-2S)-binding protein [Veillonella montpellierensis]
MDFETQTIPDSILDKYTKVCTCRSISRKTLKEAIHNGCTSIPQIKEQTRAMTGSCKGKTCASKIVALLKEMDAL